MIYTNSLRFSFPHNKNNEYTPNLSPSDQFPNQNQQHRSHEEQTLKHFGKKYQRLPLKVHCNLFFFPFRGLQSFATVIHVRKFHLKYFGRLVYMQYIKWFLLRYVVFPVTKCVLIVISVPSGKVRRFFLNAFRLLSFHQKNFHPILKITYSFTNYSRVT